MNLPQSYHFTLLMMVTSIIFWGMINVLSVEGAPLSQEPSIGPVRCNYESLLNGAPRPFDPNEKKLIEQQTDVKVRCTFDATIPPGSSLVVSSGLESWNGTVVANPPGGDEKEDSIQGSEDIVEIVGGTIDVTLQGRTPRGIRQAKDPHGYLRELHWAQSFDLVKMAIRPPTGPDVGVEQENIEAASLLYIDTVEKLESIRGSIPESIWTEAQTLLEEGFPRFALLTLDVAQKSQEDRQSIFTGLWLWGAIGLVLGIALVSGLWFAVGKTNKDSVTSQRTKRGSSGSGTRTSESPPESSSPVGESGRAPRRRRRVE